MQQRLATRDHAHDADHMNMVKEMLMTAHPTVQHWVRHLSYKRNIPKHCVCRQRKEQKDKEIASIAQPLRIHSIEDKINVTIVSQ